MKIALKLGIRNEEIQNERKSAELNKLYCTSVFALAFSVGFFM